MYIHCILTSTWADCASVSSALLSLLSQLKNFFNEPFESCFVSVGFSCGSTILLMGFNHMILLTLGDQSTPNGNTVKIVNGSC